MNQTWLPSQTGPTVLITMRRSTSVRADKRQQHGRAEIETVHDRKADQQDAQQRPPDQAQDFVVEHGHAFRSLAAAGRDRAGTPGGGAIAVGPSRMYFTSR